MVEKKSTFRSSNKGGGQKAKSGRVCLIGGGDISFGGSPLSLLSPLPLHKNPL